MIRRKEPSLSRWGWTLGLTLLTSSVNLMFENQNWITWIIFVFCYSIVGLFVYIILKYLNDSAEPLSISLFSLMIMDIDYFKKVNDTYGHSAGNAMLSQFAEALRSTVRQREDSGRNGQGIKKENRARGMCVAFL
ncbi:MULTISPECIES: diguanylate cyclase [unclassified Paenibacillus]|uniref:diguanylate cyclase n=1 Tax=unclassified Paenibacillus TaxID=185978 RepID=UPI000839D454|nr:MULTISPECIES: diguanylate cyclase [unclassified Paenibacillus]NWL89916.1 GGDEF domain-containing protein [Paenibacillus sp. 79R4]